MEKIEFKNNSEPYLSAENLNKIQDSIENEFYNIKNKFKKIYAKVGKSDNLTISKGTYNKIPFNVIIDINEGVELTTDGGIKIIDNDISIAIINTRIRFNSGTLINLAIRKNNDETNLAVVGTDITAYNHAQASGIINVQKNDVIYIYAYCDADNTAMGGGNPPIWVSMDFLGI